MDCCVELSFQFFILLGCKIAKTIAAEAAACDNLNLNLPSVLPLPLLPKTPKLPPTWREPTRTCCMTTTIC
jgi:hypothetical protein